MPARAPGSVAARRPLAELVALAGPRADRSYAFVQGVFEEHYNGSARAVERYGVNPASGYSSLWAAPCGGSWGWPDTSHAYGMWSTGPPELGVTPAQARYDVPNSGHEKIVLIALMDGSVRPVGPQVSAATWLRAVGEFPEL